MMKMTTTKPTQKLLIHSALVISACATLAACQTTGNAGKTAGVDSAMQRAAAQNAGEMDKTPASVAWLEKAYLRDPANEEGAIKYAAALREENYSNRAAAILGRMADDPKSSARLKTEYTAIQLSMGNNETAQKYAQRAVAQDPADARAHHYLGIALDAQGKHPEAEKSFRKALDLWQGDPTTIMNNLALNLSAQGYIDEAVQILEKAKTISPGKIEIERNLRIVRTLKQSENPTTPHPVKKPKPL
jgi:Flp pilus assembly protein TadD